jgi:hypothetical protein
MNGIYFLCRYFCMSHHKCLAKCCSYGTVSLMSVRTVCGKTSGYIQNMLLYCSSETYYLSPMQQWSGDNSETYYHLCHSDLATEDHAVNICQAGVQILACLTTTVAPQTTLNAALDVILGLPQLRIFIKAEGPLASYWLTLTGITFWDIPELPRKWKYGQWKVCLPTTYFPNTAKDHFRSSWSQEE